MEGENWRRLGEKALRDGSAPNDFNDAIRADLLPVFRYYAGARMAAAGQAEKAMEWIGAGVLEEKAGLLSNAFLSGFLKRHDGKLVMPAVAFSDPRPFVHFTTIPAIKESRASFIKCCGDSLPRIGHPIKIMDIGCGNGALIADLLKHLRSIGKIDDIAEILLIDASPAMIDLAKETVGAVLPSTPVRSAVGRFEDVEGKIDSGYDIALSSLAYHHMPMEKKERHLKGLKQWIDHFIIFEVDANHDSPEMDSPELALSMYQSYGRMIDFVFQHDAPVDIVLACVDCFLMTEAVSMLTQPRGKRTEYHMLRTQWLDLFNKTLAPELKCLCDATCYGDPHLDMFAIHYAR